MPESKVCPYCGNDWFVVQQKIKILTNLTTGEQRPQMDTLGPIISVPICNNCQRKVEAFVTEQFFYEVICDPDFDDTEIIVIPQEEAALIIERLRQPQSKRSVSHVVYHSSTVNGKYRVDLTISNDHSQIELSLYDTDPSKVHDDPVFTAKFPGSPPQLLGRYEIEYNDKKYAVIVMTTESDMNDDQCISNVTLGNTEGNEGKQA